MIALSQRAHMFARPEVRSQLSAFFADILECAAIELPGTDIVAFRFANGASVSVEFTDEAPEPEQLRRAAWLEVLCDDPAALRAKVLAAGLPQISYLTGGFYFQSPGGQVWGIPDRQTS